MHSMRKSEQCGSQPCSSMKGFSLLDDPLIRQICILLGILQSQKTTHISWAAAYTGTPTSLFLPLRCVCVCVCVCVIKLLAFSILTSLGDVIWCKCSRLSQSSCCSCSYLLISWGTVDRRWHLQRAAVIQLWRSLQLRSHRTTRVTAMTTTTTTTTTMIQPVLVIKPRLQCRRKSLQQRFVFLYQFVTVTISCMVQTVYTNVRRCPWHNTIIPDRTVLHRYTRCHNCLQCTPRGNFAVIRTDRKSLQALSLDVAKSVSTVSFSPELTTVTVCCLGLHGTNLIDCSPFWTRQPDYRSAQRIMTTVVVHSLVVLCVGFLLSTVRRIVSVSPASSIVCTV